MLLNLLPALCSQVIAHHQCVSRLFPSQEFENSCSVLVPPWPMEYLQPALQCFPFPGRDSFVSHDSVCSLFFLSLWLLFWICASEKSLHSTQAFCAGIPFVPYIRSITCAGKKYEPLSIAHDFHVYSFVIHCLLFVWDKMLAFNSRIFHGNGLATACSSTCKTTELIHFHLAEDTRSCFWTSQQAHVEVLIMSHLNYCDMLFFAFACSHAECSSRDIFHPLFILFLWTWSKLSEYPHWVLP